MFGPPPNPKVGLAAKGAFADVAEACELNFVFTSKLGTDYQLHATFPVIEDLSHDLIIGLPDLVMNQTSTRDGAV
jgi:hypothetical protein